jgi:hypothetical protein
MRTGPTPVHHACRTFFIRNAGHAAAKRINAAPLRRRRRREAVGESAPMGARGASSWFERNRNVELVATY